VQLFLQWETHTFYIFREYVCSLRYPACNAHAPYCHLWPARPYNIFLIASDTAPLKKKSVIEHKICVILSTTFVGIFLGLRRNDRDILKNVTGLHVKYPLFLFDFHDT